MSSNNSRDDVSASIESVSWLDRRLQSALRKHNRIIITTFAVLAAALLSLTLFIYGILDFLVRFPQAVRIVLTLGLGISAVFLFRYGKRRLISLLKSNEDVVRRVEQVQARAGKSQRSLLISALEFGKKPEIGGSPSLKNRTIALAKEKCVNPAKVRIYDVIYMRRVARISGLALVAGLLTVWKAGGHAETFMARLLGVNAAYPTATRIVEVRWKPDAPMRVDYPVALRVEGELPDAGNMRVKLGGRSFSLPLKPVPEETGLYKAIVTTPLESFSFNFRLGDYRSRKYEVNIRPPPMIVSSSIIVHPPPYTGQPKQTVPLESLEVPEGSMVKFQAVPNVPITECRLLLGKTNIVMQKTGKGYETEIAAEASHPFSVHFKDAFGVVNKDVPRYYLSVKPDETPAVTIRNPQSDVFRSNLSRVDFAVVAEDDYALKDLRLDYRICRPLPGGDSVEEEKEKVTGKGSIPLGSVEGRKEAVKRLSRLVREFKARPGDRIAVQAVAMDNRKDTGGEGRSAELSLYVVSPEELRNIIAKEKEQVINLLAKLRDDEKRQYEALEERLKQ